MNYELFLQACDDVMKQEQGLNGIGTLSEKTVHSVIKHYLSPEISTQEIKIGDFIADICIGNEIYEIQTRSFNKLRRKLTAFLDLYSVTIVYPVPYIKWLRWVDPQTGEISRPRKSPKRGSPYIIMPELYKIKNFLMKSGLRLHIIMMDMEEYKYLDGWSKDKKKGSTRCDRIPTALVKEIKINCPLDYQIFIPESLDSNFTSRDYKKATRLSMNASQIALNVLNYIGVVERIGKKGRAFVYTRKNVTTSKKFPTSKT